jgi:hypothetical protein
MSAEDFRINAFVRQVLSRSWVDTDALRYGAVGRIVYFHGRFHRVRPASEDDTGHPLRMRLEHLNENLALLDRVEKEIRREPGVADVVFRLDNFRKVNGKWSFVEV